MQLDPLDDSISSVEMIACMGDDLMVVNAARVSMAKVSSWEIDDDDAWDLEYLSDKDKKLIKYLAKHNHWTPFSHPQIQFRIKMPIFVARQWFKHMIGFTRNEVSRRYVSDSPEFYQPTEWRLRADNVKQGSSEEVYRGPMGNNKGHTTPNSVVREAAHIYNTMIEKGICPEQARMILPQSMYTEFIETGSLAAYARLAKLRLDPHAQKEVRLYAAAVSNTIKLRFPESWEALGG